MKCYSRLSSSLKCVMKERMVVQKNIIDVEAAHRDLHIKLYRKVRHWHELLKTIKINTNCKAHILIGLDKFVKVLMHEWHHES